MDGKTKIIIMVVVFIVSMALIFIGQKNVGYTGLATGLSWIDRSNLHI